MRWRSARVSPAFPLQPNSGAQGEYAGLLVIRAYHESSGDHHRNVALIPSSAHGTNPASAAMVGMKIVVVKADDEGHVDIADLRAKAKQYKERAQLPDGDLPEHARCYEEGITEITGIIHRERRSRVHGRREHERPSGLDQSRQHRC
jgi:glycine dehydrogenase